MNQLLFRRAMSLIAAMVFFPLAVRPANASHEVSACKGAPAQAQDWLTTSASIDVFLMPALRADKEKSMPADAHVIMTSAGDSAFACDGQNAPPAIAVNQKEASIEVDEPAVLPMPLLPPAEQLRDTPKHLELYQWDRTPLNGRRILLLIHGGGGEHKPVFRWDKVLDYFSKDPEFTKTFKVVLMRYDSTGSLEDEVEDAKKAIPALSKSSGDKPVTIIALSMGGNIVQGALTDASVGKCVERAICLGTPFHGSPLFSPDWFQYSLAKYTPITRLVNSLDYRLYFSRHKNYQQLLKWDNVDGSIPQAGRFHSLTPLGPRGVLTISRDSNPRLTKTNEEVAKDKIIAYAGYLLNPDIMTATAKHRMESFVLAPYRFFTIRVPAQLGREQPALKVLNREISRMKGVDESGHETRRYSLNDGITPISSALFLSPDVVRNHSIVHEADLHLLRDLVDIKLGRVFRNIDHITFVEGSPPHRGSTALKDELHPEDGRRPIFEWMLDEVMVRNQADRKDDELASQ